MFQRMYASLAVKYLFLSVPDGVQSINVIRTHEMYKVIISLTIGKRFGRMTFIKHVKCVCHNNYHYFSFQNDLSIPVLALLNDV